MEGSGIHLDKQSDPILFFDGHCNLCHRAIRFILKNEKTPKIRFCMLHSSAAELLLLPFGGLEAQASNSILFLENQKITGEAEACFQISQYLGFPWNWLKFLKIFPKSWSNAVYSWVAANRYKWFGSSKDCPIFDQLQKRRWLE